MMIPEKILLEYNAELKIYKKGDFIFKKGDKARYYYQIVEGEIKMNNYNDNGKEFIQGIFKKGKSFGEPPLFIDRRYPSNEEVIKKSKIFRLRKKNFLIYYKREIYLLKLYKYLLKDYIIKL